MSDTEQEGEGEQCTSSPSFLLNTRSSWCVGVWVCRENPEGSVRRPPALARLAGQRGAGVLLSLAPGIAGMCFHREAQVSSCLWLLGVGMAGVCYHIQLFVPTLRNPNSSLDTLAWQALCRPPCPQSLSQFFCYKLSACDLSTLAFFLVRELS